VSDIEVPLAGGNVAPAVVRSGDTVRKPWTEATPSVQAYLHHLQTHRFPAAPRPLGRDDRGRQVLEYVDGTLGQELRPFDLSSLHRLGTLVRRLHDVSASFVPAPEGHWAVLSPAVDVPDVGAALICHHDLAPWNLICGRDRWVFIDWDGAGPSTRLWDLAYAARAFAELAANGDPGLDGTRLRAFVDGYAADRQQREALPELLARRTRRMYDVLADAYRTGRQPWARMYTEGHGDYWRDATDYVSSHQQTWRKALLDD
jgi:Ser/Thr protein kinase RdoA (MazF antagonist)